jgi:hypothetical protein
MPEPGVIIWTSPLGHTYRIQPPPIMPTNSTPATPPTPPTPPTPAAPANATPNQT